MAKELDGVSLLDILPPNILEDEQINAAARAIDAELQKAPAAVQECLFLPHLDSLPESVLDLLAWQWHVDFYEPTELEKSVKCELIRKSIAWHRKKGTPAAVEEVVSAAFEKSWVKEWFEYGGNPFYFKVITEDVTTDKDEIERMKRAINAAKNVRSWLEGIEFLLHLSDTETMSSAYNLDVIRNGIEHYAWRGRYANGAYCAMEPTVFNGSCYAAGELVADGVPLGKEDGFYSPCIADGGYMADGTIGAKCYHDTRLIYADSLEPDVLALSYELSQSEKYGVVLYADGRWAADGSAVAGYNDVCDAPIIAEAVLSASDSEKISESEGLRLATAEVENYPLAHMYYADGTWAAGSMITADGTWAANSDRKADGLGAPLDQCTPPTVYDGSHLADGGITPAARPIAGTAGADADANDNIFIANTMVANETIKVVEAAETFTAMNMTDAIDGEYFANGECLATGGITAAGHSVEEAIGMELALDAADNLDHIVYANGSTGADGSTIAGNDAGPWGELTVIVGMGRIADGSAVANAGGAIYADGTCGANGDYTAMQFRLARYTANGGIYANGEHFTGRGGDICDYQYIAA